MSQYYNLNMTGPELTERLDKVLVNELAIGDEVTRAQAVEATKANANDVYTKAQTDAAIDADVLVETTRMMSIQRLRPTRLLMLTFSWKLHELRLWRQQSRE